MTGAGNQQQQEVRGHQREALPEPSDVCRVRLRMLQEHCMGEGTAIPPFSCLIPVCPPTCFLLAVKAWERSSHAVLFTVLLLCQPSGSCSDLRDLQTHTCAGGVPGVPVLGWRKPCLKNILLKSDWSVLKATYAVAPGR